MIVKPFWNKKGCHERRGMYWGRLSRNIKIFEIQMGSFSIYLVNVYTTRSADNNIISVFLLLQNHYQFVLFKTPKYTAFRNHLINLWPIEMRSNEWFETQVLRQVECKPFCSKSVLITPYNDCVCVRVLYTGPSCPYFGLVLVPQCLELPDTKPASTQTRNISYRKIRSLIPEKSAKSDC